jgi:replication factor A1
MPRQKISELTEEMKDITMKAKVMSINSRNIRNERGESTYYYGYLGDETGTIPYTAWAFPASLKAGDVVDMKNVYTKKYNDSIRVYLDSRSQVILDPNSEMEVKRVYRKYSIRDLSLRDQYVEVSGIVTGIRTREYDREGKVQKVYQGFIEDATGKVRFSSFGREVEENKPLRFLGARVTEFNGRLSLSVSDKTEITTAEKISIPASRVYQLQEIRNPVGGVSISGFVVSVGEKSGIVYRCSQCSKTVQNGSCPDHPDAGKIEDIFAYFSVDDGTGVIQCSAGSASLLPFLGIKGESIKNIDERKKDEIHTNIRNGLIGMPIFATGEFRKMKEDLSFRVETFRKVSAAELKLISTPAEGEI